ncbi:alpha/beta fold hydrolase [Amycolatopsis alkalitolerans]|uniref:alpha/beta fold hydrolase n=1 Tax=Amycolatopsis alkalitolerans TaxID=2547244 RepID=UPI00190FA9C6|nr:alpha/beta hydrolase [Amycolatopsis alkalitolerans]
MATFVLIHGGWSGAHGWRAVRKVLAAGGHEVFTPSLTGIGERVHLAGPMVDLTTHVHDVVNHVVFEDLRDIVAVGYSYGGAVVTGALAHIHDRIRELVYLDAFVPADGESVSGQAGPSLVGLGDQWLVPPADRQYDDPDEGAWQSARRVPHPVRCFTEPVRLPRPVEEYDFGLTYIKATVDPVGGNPFWVAAEHARASNH